MARRNVQPLLKVKVRPACLRCARTDYSCDGTRVARYRPGAGVSSGYEHSVSSWTSSRASRSVRHAVIAVCRVLGAKQTFGASSKGPRIIFCHRDSPTTQGWGAQAVRHALPRWFCCRCCPRCKTALLLGAFTVERSPSPAPIAAREKHNRQTGCRGAMLRPGALRQQRALPTCRLSAPRRYWQQRRKRQPGCV
jgi:hypothetical protein